MRGLGPQLYGVGIMKERRTRGKGGVDLPAKPATVNDSLWLEPPGASRPCHKSSPSKIIGLPAGPRSGMSSRRPPTATCRPHSGCSLAARSAAANASPAPFPPPCHQPGASMQLHSPGGTTDPPSFCPGSTSTHCATRSPRTFTSRSNCSSELGSCRASHDAADATPATA